MRRTWIFAWAWTIGAVLAAEAQTAYNALRVSQLPPCNVARQGRLLTVNDADPDCQTGSGEAGSGYAACVCDPVLGWILPPGSSGGSAGVGGALGSLDNSVPRTVGAGGATLEGTTLTIDDANNLVLGAGAALSGIDNYVRVRTPGGGYNLGNGTFQDSGGAGRSWLINLAVSGSGTQPVYSGANDVTTGSGNCASGAVCLTASGVESLRATTTAVKVLTLQLASSDSAPYACDAGAAGSSYYDTTGDDTFCDCMGAGWVMRYPLQTGANCS